MSRPRNPLAASGESRLALLRLALLVVSFLALIPLIRWGAVLGPTRLFRVIWAVSLLAMAAAQVALAEWRAPRRQQLAGLLKWCLPASLLGWFTGLGVIGFDTVGLFTFLNYQALFGLGLGMAGTALESAR